MTTVHHHESLWREHRQRLHRFVLKRVGDSATAENIVHDVLVRAWRHQDRLTNEQKFEPWLYRITRNAVIDHYRAKELSHCIQPFIDCCKVEFDNRGSVDGRITVIDGQGA